MESLLSVLENKYNVNGDCSIYKLTELYEEIKISAYKEMISVINDSDYLYQFKDSFNGKKRKIKDVLPEKTITKGIKIHLDDKCSVPPKVFGSDVKRVSCIDNADVIVVPCDAIINIVRFKIFIDYESYNIFIASEDVWNIINNDSKFSHYNKALCGSRVNSKYVGDEYVVLSDLNEYSLNVINDFNRGFITEKNYI